MIYKNKFIGEIYNIIIINNSYKFSNINNRNNNNDNNKSYINYRSNNIIINNNININSRINQNQNQNELIPSFIGLDNIGATCYMNASLQCMSNVIELTKYFLNHNLNSINNNEKTLSFAYQELIQNLWPKNNNYLYKKSYAPYNFKKIVSNMNPLFKGIQANDSKDLILFLLERIHSELNQKKNINSYINQNTVKNQGYTIYDFNTAFNLFSNNFMKDYNSIISNLFYGAECNSTKCFSCNAISYNVQCYNILIFPLEKVRLFKGYNRNQYITITDCFEYRRNPEYFYGENQIYCNNCKQNSQACNWSYLVYGPNVLVINLNRGKGLEFSVKLNFELYLDISNFVTNNLSPKKYELIGVVQHYGESSMSGHFIAYCKCKFDNNWYKYNDSIVSKVNYNEMYTSGIINNVPKEIQNNIVYLTEQINNITIIWNKEITDCSYMFENLINITYIDLSSFNASLVTNMYRMFCGCTALKKKI